MIKFGDIKGKPQIIRNINKIIQLLPSRGIKYGLFKSCEILRDVSISNLNTSVGSGKWPSLGKSIDGTSIRNKNNWLIEDTGSISYTLSCISPHSEIVELGSPGRYIWSENAIGKWKGWPVGKQQGNIIGYYSKIELQKGYHYLRDAMNSPSIKNRILQTMANEASKSLRSIL